MATRRFRFHGKIVSRKISKITAVGRVGKFPRQQRRQGTVTAAAAEDQERGGHSFKLSASKNCPFGRLKTYRTFCSGSDQLNPNGKNCLFSRMGYFLHSPPSSPPPPKTVSNLSGYRFSYSSCRSLPAFCFKENPQNTKLVRNTCRL